MLSNNPINKVIPKAHPKTNKISNNKCNSKTVLQTKHQKLKQTKFNKKYLNWQEKKNKISKMTDGS